MKPETKAHVGVAGNELADSYAKQATLKEDIDFHLNSTFKSIKKAAHNAIKMAWQQQWTNCVKGRAVHMLCPKVNFNRLHGNYFINQLLDMELLPSININSSAPIQSATVEKKWKTDHIFLNVNCRRKLEENTSLIKYLFQFLTNKQVRTGIEQIMKKKLENILETMDS
ncbi:hypothetical protein CDAR_495131 [Caerostris darwini]|uniref:RNase H type-1 domain-containing protein n=1 Tax=Caerostris darwini TaxID=1538125 RepID=A0AAV4UX16_9ARAC|nr:hypothetical protein CDAR_495131 [Caerostris darwini]